MKLYFYFIEFRLLESGETEHFLLRKEMEARETPKLYLPAQDIAFPCYLTRLPKERVDAGISDGFLILTKPDEEAARALWKQHYEKNADTLTRRAEECRKLAEANRKIAANL